MPKIIDKEAKKLQVMDAAYDLFIEKGYKSVTTREITSKAGVSKGVLYDYFDSKEDLFYQTVREHMIKNIAMHPEDLEQSESVEERMYGFLEYCSTHSEKMEQKLFMMFDFILNCPDKSLRDEIVGNLYNLISMHIEKILKDVFPAAYTDRETARIYTNIFVAFLDGLHFQFLSSLDKTMIKKTFTAFWAMFHDKMKSQNQG